MSSGAVEQAAGARPVAAPGQAVPGGLRLQHAHADQVLAQLARSVADRRHQIGARVHDIADAFDPIGGRDARQDVPVRIDRPSARQVGMLDGHSQHVDGDLRDLQRSTSHR